MKRCCSSLRFALRGPSASLLAAPAPAAWLALALALTGCNGTAVVTMTSTASQDGFLAYRVGLVSVELESSSGKSGLKILPASTTVDFATLTQLSEVLGAAAVAKGSYKSALVTLDYSSAQIVYDDGSLNGVTLTPIDANGQAVGQIQLTVNLDPDDSFSVAAKGASQLALDFNLAASNAVNVSAKTVTVTPVIAASALPIDSKQVRIRGPIAGVASAITMGVVPFNGTSGGAGTLSVVPSDTTTYEVNGIASSGAAGLEQLASVGTGALTVAYGTLTSADQTSTTTTPEGTTSTTSISNVSFTAAQVLSGSSVQGEGFDRVTGIVSGRSGGTLTVEDGTLVSNEGTESFLGGTTFVIIGPNTAVTVFGVADGSINGPQQISVGSSIDAFGLVTGQSLGNATLDASAGHVRLDPTIASGLVTAQGSGALTLNLASLDGRSIAPFDFVGSGADAGAYVIATGQLDLTNSAAGAPVAVTGLPGPFGAAPPNFTASALLDPTTIDAELVVDWGAGTAAPFTTYNGSAIDLDVRNGSIGVRHEISVGAQVIDIVGLSSDPQIVPNPTPSNMVYSIGHLQSATIENFDTYGAFITQLQSELNGTTLATGLTAVGQYTAANFSFSATHITLSLNN